MKRNQKTLSSLPVFDKVYFYSREVFIWIYMILKMRQTYRQEMKYLLELTGYEIVNVYGGYRKESGDGSAKNVIWCVRKK